MSDYGTIKAARKSGEKLSVEALKAALLAESAPLAAAEATKAQTSAAYQAALKADNDAHREVVDRRRHVSKLKRWLDQAEGKVPADSVNDPWKVPADKPSELAGELDDEEPAEEDFEGLDDEDAGEDEEELDDDEG